MCEACDTVIDLDLTVKRRDPDTPIRVALNDVRCPRCNVMAGRGTLVCRGIRQFEKNTVTRKRMSGCQQPRLRPTMKLTRALSLGPDHPISGQKRLRIGAVQT